MATVEDKVVAMKFDNQEFQRRLAVTMNGLDQLKKSLNFEGAQRNISDLSSAGKNFTMGNMAGAVEGVSAKFLALATIGITALSRLTSKAIDAGTRIVKSLSLDPVMQGFQEYETNMNSIQTILANTKSKGSTLEDVDKALQQLNEYADQTIYNFSEMTRNIGTFTAAGVDLDSSVNAIKGIANLAAISGSNSQQASTAMYQLSQALAAGRVNLMDWNSVVNAGMGGEVFKKALFETGKAMKTITDVPLGASFEEWEEKGGTFREQMQKGWLTADVLSTTLQAFSGDLDIAGLKAAGFSEEAARQMVELGELGIAAATEVKTFTQLIDTVKEAIGTGWADSFRILIGDFEEAKELWTSVSNAIGEFVGKTAKARNDLLSGWKFLGGRTLLIEGFKDAIAGIASVLKPVREAFRTVFPPATALTLLGLTERFAEFAKNLKIGGETADKVRRAFQGVFSVFSIGWEIVKNLFGLFGDIISEFSGAGSGALGFAANMGDVTMSLREALVEGGGIRDFFEKLSEAIRKPIRWLIDFSSKIIDAVTSLTGFEAAEDAIDNVGKRVDNLATAADKIAAAWSWLVDVFGKIGEALSGVWDVIEEFVSNFADGLADAFNTEDFSGVTDALSVGLIGAIAVILRKFAKDGIQFDFGGGFMEGITDALDQLTGTLSAMQANLRADALQKLAIAIAILAASVLVLASINPDDLAKAMTALTVAMGQLITAMALMGKFNLGTGSAQMIAAGTAMITLSVAVGILSIAIKNLSSLSLGDLAKGLGGVAAALGILVGATSLITTNTSGLIRAGVSMIGISIAMIILAEAVEKFSEFDWGEMGRGLAGVAGGLAILVAGVNFLPVSGLIRAGIGLAIVSATMLLLAEAVQTFAAIPMDDVGRGFFGIGAGLGILAAGMNLMPPNLPATAIGLVLVSGALLVLAEALTNMAEIKFTSMVKALGGLAVMLGVLAIAMYAMTGTIGGAVSLAIVSVALLGLAEVLQELGKLSIGQLAAGLISIALALAIIGAAGLILTPVIPSLLGLGAAMFLLGTGFAAFGAGAALLAKAFELIAKTGKAGVQAFIGVLEEMLKALPRLLGAALAGVIGFVTEFVDQFPALLDAMKEILSGLLGLVVEMVPQIGEALSALITEGIRLIRQHFPELTYTIIDMVLVLLMALESRMPMIAQAGINIIVKLMEGIRNNMNRIVNTAVDVLNSFLTAIAARVPDIVAAGISILVEFLRGVEQNIGNVTGAVGRIITKFITEIGNLASDIVDAGVDAVSDFLDGVRESVTRLSKKFAETGTKIMKAIADAILFTVDEAADVLSSFLYRLGQAIRDNGEQIGAAARYLARSIIAGLVAALGLPEIYGALKRAVEDMAGNVVGWFAEKLGVSSPSKVFMEQGGYLVQGLIIGLNKGQNDVYSQVDSLGDGLTEALRKTIKKSSNALDGFGDINPVIRPVLDLTDVQRGAKALGGLLDTKANISAEISPVSYSKARDISTTAELTGRDDPSPVREVTEVTFNQYNNSPEPLSTKDIYKNTSSQIALAKEELGV